MKKQLIRLAFIFSLLAILMTFVTIASFYSNTALAQSSYDSGFEHGCSDKKISNPDHRYINQPSKGPEYHTDLFMSGYNNGFDSCVAEGHSFQTDQEIFKVIVNVLNHSNRDIYGGITISVDHYPKDIFKSAYGVYFPGGETLSKTFTFKSSDVPIGTAFEVNIDYGDDFNQYQYGENSPSKKAEVVYFNIS
jgi:hypothetical protein